MCDCAVPGLRQLEELVLASWFDIDLADCSQIGSFFTADARLSINGSEPLVGSQTIHDGYQARRTRGDRTSRHVVSNFRVISATASGAETYCSVVIYAGDGVPPLDGSEPILVSDEFDTFARGEDGRWLVSDRRLVNIFRNPDASVSLPSAVAHSVAEKPGAAGPTP